MIDYEERIEDLHSHLQKMGVVDRQATEIILSCSIPIHPQSLYPPLWIVLDAPATGELRWFDFQTVEIDTRMRLWRRDRPYYTREPIRELLERRKENRLFIDIEAPTHIPLRNLISDLDVNTLKLRPVADEGHLPDMNQIREARRLAQLCVRKEHRDVFPRQWKVDERLMERMRTMVKIHVLYGAHWEELYKNVSMAVSSRAALFGRDLSREKAEANDLAAGGRLLRDTLSTADRSILKVAIEGTREAGEEGKGEWINITKIIERSGYDRHVVREKIRKMTRTGVVSKRDGRMVGMSAEIKDFLESPF